MGKRLIKILILTVLCSALLTASVFAEAPYFTFTRSGERSVMTQSAYEPYGSIVKIGDFSLSAPSDIRFGPDGYLYIADTGNKRVIVSDINGELVRVIGEGILQAPEGLFVTGDGKLYVADELAETVFVFDASGSVTGEYTRPDHPLFGKYALYKPQKVVVDKRGNVYVTSKGNTNGVVQFAASGSEFLGYFGANITRVTLMTQFQQLIYNEEQMNQLADIAPITVSNLAIDGDGLVYTVSTGAENGLKKLNVAGRDILNIEEGWNDSTYVAVTVADNGNIFAASYQHIVEYTAEGDFLFMFGWGDDGQQQRNGLFSSISGLAVDGGHRLYILDEVKNIIQILAPTEFAGQVHTAFALFNEGRYAESKEPWTEIVKMNSMFSYAGIGLGEANYREKDYAAALTSFRRGFNKQGYSDAFWELRSDWLKDNTGYIIIGLFALVIIWNAVRIADRRFAVLAPVRNVTASVKKIKILSQTMFTFRNIKNPSDVAYGIKHEGRAGYLSSFILFVVFYLLFVLEKYGAGFLFKTVNDGYYDMVGDAGTVIAAFGLPVICCYLVCTINDGEASFKELLCGVIYAFAPVFLLKPLGIVLTNVLTLNEAFFITLTSFIAYAWTALLVFLAIKNLNDYTFGKTIRIIFLTLFVTLISAMLIFIIYVLVMQVVDFVSSVAGEAVYKWAG